MKKGLLAVVLLGLVSVAETGTVAVYKPCRDDYGKLYNHSGRGG
ncbi:MAG: hypothetical protein V2A53_00200 [bacterium]